MIKKITFLILTLTFQSNAQINFHNYFNTKYRPDYQFYLKRKLSQIKTFDLKKITASELIKILDKTLTLNVKDLNDLITSFHNILKEKYYKESPEPFKTIIKKTPSQPETRSIISPDLSSNIKAFSDFIYYLIDIGIIQYDLKIQNDFRLIFIENFFKKINYKLEAFIIIAILKILNPNNVYIIHKPINNQKKMLKENDLSDFSKFKKEYLKKYTKETPNNVMIKMFYMMKKIPCHASIKQQNTLAHNLVVTLCKIPNLLSFMDIINNKYLYSYSYDIGLKAKNIHLNKNFNSYIKSSLIIKEKNKYKFVFKKQPPKPFKISDNFIYKISPINNKSNESQLLLFILYEYNSKIKMGTISI